MTAADEKPSSGPSPHSSSRPQAWWQWWLMYPALGVAILGALPTAINGVQAVRLGLPYSDVPTANKNNDLFAKNFDCLKKTGPAVQLKDNTEVQAVICDSGDIWIRVTTADNQSGIIWISPADIAPRKHSGMLIGEAYGGSPGTQTAANGEVLCVFRDKSGRIIRKVSVAPGKCQDEQIDPYTGAVTVVAANCSCPH
jgi:hypothetical protein